MNHNAQRGFAGLRAGPCLQVHSDEATVRVAPRADITETIVRSFDGHAFALRRSGRGSPILLLHDMAATQRAWDPIRAALSWSNTVGTWDARGHGASRATPEVAVPTMGLLAADLDAAITACAPELPVLVGHGLGALTILEHLRNYDPGRVSRVVLVDQSPMMLTAPDWPLGLFGKFDASDAREFEARIRVDFADAWMRLQARGFDGTSGAGNDAHCRHLETIRRNLHRLANGSMQALWHSMIRRDYRSDLRSVQLPVLAMLGGSSNMYDAPRLGHWFLDCVPGAQVIRYPRADHALHAAAPARFARDVAAFAARRAPVARHPLVEVVATGSDVHSPGRKSHRTHDKAVAQTLAGRA